MLSRVLSSEHHPSFVNQRDLNFPFTDGIACYHLLDSKVAVSTEVFQTAYVGLLCVGVTSTGVSIVYRARNALLLKRQVADLGTQLTQSPTRSRSLTKIALQQPRIGRDSELRRHVQQQEWELEKTHRIKITATLTVMSVVVQGAYAIARAMPLSRDVKLESYVVQVSRCRS